MKKTLSLGTACGTWCNNPTWGCWLKYSDRWPHSSFVACGIITQHFCTNFTTYTLLGLKEQQQTCLMTCLLAATAEALYLWNAHWIKDVWAVLFFSSLWLRAHNIAVDFSWCCLDCPSPWSMIVDTCWCCDEYYDIYKFFPCIQYIFSWFVIAVYPINIKLVWHL